MCVSQDISKSIATSLVDARPDYCNAILYGTSDNNIDKVQSVQNTLARAVKEGGKYDHIFILHHYSLNYIGYRLTCVSYSSQDCILTFKAVSTGLLNWFSVKFTTHWYDTIQYSFNDQVDMPQLACQLGY
jgi:hypothetical protein